MIPELEFKDQPFALQTITARERGSRNEYSLCREQDLIRFGTGPVFVRCVACFRSKSHICSEFNHHVLGLHQLVGQKIRTNSDEEPETQQPRKSSRNVTSKYLK